LKYQKPAVRTSTEILDLLHTSGASPQERIDAVLSAIFHNESVEAAGDILIEEFSTAEYAERIYLKNLFQTFYQARQTTYRIDDSVLLLRSYKDGAPNEAEEIGETIEALLEYKSIFSSG
jgi:hypothetical protein